MFFISVAILASLLRAFKKMQRRNNQSSAWLSAVVNTGLVKAVGPFIPLLPSVVNVAIYCDFWNIIIIVPSRLENVQGEYKKSSQFHKFVAWKYIQTPRHYITIAKVLNQSVHLLLQWFAARGTVGKEMATPLQNAKYVLWFW
jgi:hypothetical protein